MKKLIRLSVLPILASVFLLNSTFASGNTLPLLHSEDFNTIVPL